MAKRQKSGSNSRSQADHYTLRAKREGYPARSVYKLEEIQQKFSIITRNSKVLDIGAAPGSWTLYISRKLLGTRGTLVAVDLKPLTLSPLPTGVTVLIGDAFSDDIQKLLLETAPFDTIVSDAAPSTTGNRSLDTIRSMNLAESILASVPSMLKQDGNLVMKIFQGGGEQEVLAKMRNLFLTVKTLKPKACRKDSFETFLIGLKRKELCP